MGLDGCTLQENAATQRAEPVQSQREAQRHGTSPAEPPSKARGSRPAAKMKFCNVQARTAPGCQQEPELLRLCCHAGSPARPSSSLLRHAGCRHVADHPGQSVLLRKSPAPNIRSVTAACPRHKSASRPSQRSDRLAGQNFKL